MTDGSRALLRGLEAHDVEYVFGVCGDTSIGLNTTVPVRHRGRGVLIELDQERLFEPVRKWNGSADRPEQVPGKLRTAFREATAGRPGAAHLSLPMDSLDGRCEADPYAPERTRTYPADRQARPDDAVEETVRVIEGSDRPVIVAGDGVHSSRAWPELRDLAETVGIPVATTLAGVGCIGDSPYSVGVVGENGSREYANEMLREADTLLLLGTAVESVWTEKWTQPEDGEKRIVHVDVSPESIGRNYDTEVAVPGDLRTTLDALLDRVSAAEKWDPEAIRGRHEAWVEPYAAAEDAEAFPVRPERMVADPRAVLADDAVVVSDPGTSCPYVAALYEFVEPGRHWVTPRAHGALGYAIPGVVDADCARPDAQVVGFTGDGSVGTSMGELETLVRYDVDATVVVVNNGSFSWIEAGQRSFADFSFGVDFEGVDYAGIAADVGPDGYRVEAADEFRPKLAETVGSEGPAPVDLPTVPLPEIDDVPVDWLEPDE